MGCTVHLIDAGIDTGAIITTREADVSAAKSIADMRSIVDKIQLELLADTCADIAATGSLPPLKTQRADDGRQYFRMHPELSAILEERLRSRARSSQHA